MPQVHLRKYGVETTVDFELFQIDGVDFRVDAADGGTDCTVMKDEGAEATCTNDFTDEGKGYSLVLTATEMEAARIMVYLVDTDGPKVYLDKAVCIETYGHASAQYLMDFDSFDTEAGLVDAHYDELRSGHSVQGSYGESFFVLASGTVDDSALVPTVTAFESDDITEATADHFIGARVVWVSGGLLRSRTTITDYVKAGANGRFTVDTMVEAPADGDKFILV